MDRKESYYLAKPNQDSLDLLGLQPYLCDNIKHIITQIFSIANLSSLDLPTVFLSVNYIPHPQ